MKKLDKLLITSFIAPFIATFFIALFVLIMQFLWTYIDDIVGKGASLWIIIELLFYLSLSLFPTALPIAVLISSVMLMGNLAENYELASFKSAGVPLLRIMRPLIFLTTIIAVFSFFCSNNFIPVANLKFKSRLYDIRKQKPTLSLEEGVFNDDFKDIIIHIGAKGDDNISIEDILIYDHSNYNRDRTSIITAAKGEMFATSSQEFFVMNLFDGSQYQELEPSGKGKDKNHPFLRTTFKEWTRIFDLSEFELNRTDEKLFKSHQTMLSTRQLLIAIDSIDHKIEKRNKQLYNHIGKYFQYSKDSAYSNQKVFDSSNKLRKVNENKIKPITSKDFEQKITKPLNEYSSILETFINRDRTTILNKAKSFSRSIHNQTKTTQTTLSKIMESKIKHIYELNIKFSMAAACIIFLFIGAPMGAIVRKGGFGYPLLISIIFFMLFIVLNLICKKLAQTAVIPPGLAAWIPCMILFPLGILLTYKAMNDSKILNIDRYLAFLRFITKALGS